MKNIENFLFDGLLFFDNLYWFLFRNHLIGFLLTGTFDHFLAFSAVFFFNNKERTVIYVTQILEDKVLVESSPDWVSQFNLVLFVLYQLIEHAYHLGNKIVFIVLGLVFYQIIYDQKGYFNWVVVIFRQIEKVELQQIEKSVVLYI